MKRIIVLLTAITFCLVVNAQTSYISLIEKINNTPANQFGVKRVNYGTWNDAPGAQNIWAVYDPRDSSYALCVGILGQSAFKDFVQIKQGEESSNKKVAIEKICANLDPRKWEPQQ